MPDFLLITASAMCRPIGDGMVGKGENRGLKAEPAVLRALTSRPRHTRPPLGRGAAPAAGGSVA